MCLPALDESDIAHLERTYNQNPQVRIDLRHPSRKAVLLCASSCDVQAGPGAGKTTLLAAKLLMLIPKWPWKDRGICVLSHTNIARREVERRLTEQPAGNALLFYPHFIGTFQQFVDRFLALPFLRSKGARILAIDDAIYERRTEALLWQDRNLATLVRRRKTGREIILGLVYRGPDLKLASEGGRIPYQEATPTFRSLQSLKEKLCEEGLYRYGDMYALAEAYIRGCHSIVDGLRFRFPYVFVDEMQDTDSTQDHLLQEIFEEHVVLQRFGDTNQAIYRSSDTVGRQTRFPVSEALEVEETLRFGPEFAEVASRVAVHRHMLTSPLHGFSHDPILIMFDDSTIADVLPVFGDLLIEQSISVDTACPAKAVGFRKTPGTGSATCELPYSVGDYWEAFDPGATSQSTTPDSFFGYSRRAYRELETTGEWKEPLHITQRGVSEFLVHIGVKMENGVRSTPGRLRDALKAANTAEEYNLTLMALVYAAGRCGNTPWELNMRKLCSILSQVVDGTVPFPHQFLGTPEHRDQASEVAQDNVFRHQHRGREVAIEVTTIHGVKGETHGATLVLETFWYKHDLKQ